jgi:hypothetical protein
MPDPTISANNTIQQNWAIAAREGGGAVSMKQAQAILDAAKASGGISMQELSGSREIARAAEGNERTQAAAEWLLEQVAQTKLEQGSLRHLWETIKDL